jgi:ubiquinone/menaquinone biosynthesis C-methylase UbiE
MEVRRLARGAGRPDANGASSAAHRAFAADARLQRLRATFKAIWWTATGAAARGVADPERHRNFTSDTPPPPPGSQRHGWVEAFRKDIEDVRAGLYPASDMLFADPLEALRAVADFLRDTREVEARRRRNRGVEAREHPAASAYPPYYRQNFHYQSGGWFTRESARRYEPQVEALFSGTAGAMRRRALSLLAKAWRDRDQRGLKLIDLACGSGNFLRDLRGAFPRAAVMGLDLSPAYTLEAARSSGAPVVQANLEHLPLADASLDAATCIYLFHELPPRLRPEIAAEIARVLKPGGVLAFADSVQPADQPDLARLLEAFPAFFHEPYYESWCAEDVPALFALAGLELVETDVAFLTKAWLFRKRL